MKDGRATQGKIVMGVLGVVICQISTIAELETAMHPFVQSCFL